MIGLAHKGAGKGRPPCRMLQVASRSTPANRAALPPTPHSFQARRNAALALPPRSPPRLPGRRRPPPARPGWEGRSSPRLWDSQGRGCRSPGPVDGKGPSRRGHAMNTLPRSMDGGNTLPWPRIQRQVLKRQKRMSRATRRHEVRTVRKRQRLLLHSWSARLLAVRHVTQDQRGQRTAGVDGGKSCPPPNTSPWHSPCPATAPLPLSAASGARHQARRSQDPSASQPWPIEPATPSSTAPWNPHGRRASPPRATACAPGVPATMRWQRFARPWAQKPHRSWTPTSTKALTASRLPPSSPHARRVHPCGAHCGPGAKPEGATTAPSFRPRLVPCTAAPLHFLQSC
jgi:hypothetical protein